MLDVYPSPPSAPITMFPVLRPFLNKGGAGHYISREASVERLQPLVEKHLRLLYAYDGILAQMADGPTKERLSALMPYVRTELSKLYETIFSLGGSAPTGVAMEPGSVTFGGSEANQLFALVEEERAFGKAMREEVDAVHHQERTRAILNHNADASGSRLDVLREITSALRRG